MRSTSPPKSRTFLGSGRIALHNRALRIIGKGAHHREQETGHRRVLAGESEALLEKLDLRALAGQGVDDPAQVIEVTGEAVHAVDDDGVAPARKAQHEFQLRTLGVFARGFIGEGLIERDAVQLPLCLLVQGADPDVADPLSCHRKASNVSR